MAVNSSSDQVIEGPKGGSISPLDARLPDVSLREIHESGKSAARLRVEKGVGSAVDWLEVKIEDTFSKPGRERG